jgi:hypothetical protein
MTRRFILGLCGMAKFGIAISGIETRGFLPMYGSGLALVKIGYSKIRRRALIVLLLHPSLSSSPLNLHILVSSVFSSTSTRSLAALAGRGTKFHIRMKRRRIDC